MRPAISLRKVAGAPMSVADGQLTAESIALTVRAGPGWLTWCYPWMVAVDRGGSVRRLPIVDATRAVQAVLFTIAIASWLLAGRRSRRRRKER